MGRDLNRCIQSIFAADTQLPVLLSVVRSVVSFRLIMSWQFNALLSVIGVVCVLCSGEDEHASIVSSLTYEYKEYSCEAQEATAVLSVMALEEGMGNPVLSLTSVMDVSGSMGGDRILLQQKTNKFLVEELAKATVPHKFGSVVFSSRARELTALEELTSEVAEMAKDKINDTIADGNTNLLGGIRKGFKQQTDDTSENYVRAVFVFTDGVPTEGVQDPTRIVEEVQSLVDASEGKVLIYTFGLGDELEFDLLKEIADVGGGILYVISHERDMPKAFGAALGGLLTEAALHIKYTITPTEDTEVLAVRSGGTMERRGKEVDLYLGDLFVEERRDVVISLELSQFCRSMSALMITATFTDAATFENITEEVETETVERLPLVPTKREEITPVGAQVARYDIAEGLEEADDSLARGNVSTCIRVITELKERVTKGGYTKEPSIAALLEDMKTIRLELEVAVNVTIDLRASLTGVIDAARKQRTGLTDAEKFKSVESTTTLAKRETSEEATKEVLEEEVIPTFELRMQHGLSSITEKEDHSEIEVVLTIKAPELQMGHPPLSLTTVLDKSGSMEGDAIELMIETQKRMIDWLVARNTTEIYLGVILFSDGVEELQQLTKLSDIDLKELKSSLDAVVAAGVTELGAALEQGVSEQIANPTCAGSQAVFVLTDGVPSSGRDEIAGDLASVLEEAQYPISVYSFGLGEFDSELLKDIADVGNGERYILNNETDIPYSFGDALGGLLSTTAKDVEIEIRPASSSVQISSVFPETRIRKDGTVRVSVFDIFQDESKDVLLTLHVPKEMAVGPLLDVNVSYVDVISCNTARSDRVRIRHAKPSGITERRILEKEIVLILVEAIEHCTIKGEISISIDLLTRAIKLVAESSYSEGAYTIDLEADLVFIRIMLEGTLEGTVTHEECRLILEAMKDLLETQRSKGTGERLFRIEIFYDTKFRKESRASLAKGISRRPERPAVDVFTECYNEAFEEISTERQNVTIDMNLRTVDDPGLENPSTVVFLVDAGETTRRDELELMKSVVLRTWHAYSSSEVFNTSSLCIIAYGSGVGLPLEVTPFSEATLGEIESVFDQIEPQGDSKIRDAIAAGFEILQQIRERTDLIMIPFIRRPMSKSGSVAAARQFEDLVETLNFPLTFVPFLVKIDLDVDYFLAFPPWVQSAIIRPECDRCMDTAFDQLEHQFFNRAAKRVYVQVLPNFNVTVQGVEGSLLTDDGSYLVPDLGFGETRKVPVRLSVVEHHNDEVLFTCSFKYYDMRSFYTWERESKPFDIVRVQPDILAERIAIRSTTTDKIIAARDAIKSEDYDKALTLVTHSMASITRSESEDSEVLSILKKLESLVGKIHNAFDGDIVKETVIKNLRSVMWKLNVRSFLFENSAAEGETEAKKSGRKRKDVLISIPPVVVAKPQLTLPGVLPAPTTDLELPLKFSIDAPHPSGAKVDAHVTIVIDTSTESFKTVFMNVAQALVASISGRHGKRSLKILSWSRTLSSVYENDDFNQEDVPHAIRSLREIEPSETAYYSVMLREGIKISQETKATIQTLYWIASRNPPKTLSIERQFRETIDTFQKTSSALTVICFESGLDSITSGFLTDLSRASGGEMYKLDLQDGEASRTEIKNRVVDVARKAVAWVDTVLSKNVQIKFKVGGIADLRDVAVDVASSLVTKNTIRVPSLQYGDKIGISAVLNLGVSSNAVDASSQQAVVRKLLSTNDVRELLEVSGEYYDVRKQKTETLAMGSFAVDPVEPKTFNRADLLNDLLDVTMMRLMKDLGRNDINAALTSVTQSQILVDCSGAKDRPDVQELSEKLSDLEVLLEQYSEAKTDVAPIREATEIIQNLKPDDRFVTDDGSFVASRHFPISATEEKTTFDAYIAVTVPELEETAESRRPSRHLAVSVVFDTAKYTARVLRERTILDMQIQLATDIITKLVKEEGYHITLTACGNSITKSPSLPPIDLNGTNVEDVELYFLNVDRTSDLVPLHSGLRLGLQRLEDSAEGSERLLLMFAAPFSVCPAEVPDYTDVLTPYIAHPINPVKVMTYIVGNAEVEESYSVPELTGGIRYFVASQRYISEAVSATLDAMKDIEVRGLRLRVVRPSWLKRDIRLVKGGTVVEQSPDLIVALPDMKPGTSHPVQLRMDLDAWTGDSDLFEHSLSYFRTDTERWYTKPSSVLRLRRASDPVLLARSALKKIAVDALRKAVIHLDNRRIQDAANVLHAALVEFDASPYQDDSVISLVIAYFSRVYEDLLKLLRDGSTDVEPVLQSIANKRAELDLVNTLEKRQSNEGLKLAIKSVVFFGCIFTASALLIMLSRR